MPLVAPVTSAVDGVELVDVMRTASLDFWLEQANNALTISGLSRPKSVR
jgi:hypothetical protein